MIGISKSLQPADKIPSLDPDKLDAISLHKFLS